jgi:hypothetical protein
LLVEIGYSYTELTNMSIGEYLYILDITIKAKEKQKEEIENAR